MVLFAQELEQPSSDSSWLYGVLNIWRGESKASEIHSQAWQVSAWKRGLFLTNSSHPLLMQHLMCQRQLGSAQGISPRCF